MQRRLKVTRNCSNLMFFFYKVTKTTTVNLLLNLWCAVHKLVAPELVHGVLDQLDEGDEETPRVRAVDDQPLEQHPGDLLLHGLRISFSEQVQQAAAEVMRVAVGVAQLIGDRVQEEVTGEKKSF